MDRLASVLNTLLPGDGSQWPAAGAHGLADRTRAFAGKSRESAAALSAVLDRLPEGFESGTAEFRAQALTKLEANMAEAFELVVAAAYTVYYTDPDIRDVIARLTGYENRPPQPEGYQLDPFDEALLDTVRRRTPFWREAPE